jgi:hypothetical protein
MAKGIDIEDVIAAILIGAGLYVGLRALGVIGTGGEQPGDIEPDDEPVIALEPDYGVSVTEDA